MQYLKGVEMGEGARITGSHLMSSLQEWAKLHYPQEKISANTLSIPLGKYASVSGSGVEKGRPGGISTYFFKWAELKSHLQKENLFDNEML